jgi:hypothetical protein
MAASIVVPGHAPADPRGIAARAAARSAPRGPGLAAVIALPLAGVPASPASPPAARTVGLRIVPPAAPRRRGGARLVGLAVAVAILLGGVASVARTGSAGPAEPVAIGHVVLQPGETLWDVAVRSAPVGVDARRQLDTLRRLNGFGPGALDAWTVVLIPAV